MDTLDKNEAAQLFGAIRDAAMKASNDLARLGITADTLTFAQILAVNNVQDLAANAPKAVSRTTTQATPQDTQNTETSAS